MVEDLLTTIERELMVGGGRWLGEFNEAFRDFEVESTKFNVYVRGRLRGKGFIISRIIMQLLTPDYLLGCFVYKADRGTQVSMTHLSRMIEAMKRRMKEDDLRFSWLIIIQKRFQNPLKRYVKRISRSDFGVILCETSPGELTYDEGLGKTMAKRVMNKVIKKRRELR